jgi:transcriptional regulator with XRE-family HTH domain
MDYQAIGRHIRAKRKALRMTQEKLAEKVDLSVSFIGHIERGSRKASIETLSQLCDALTLSMDQVLDRTNIPRLNRNELARELLYHALQLAEKLRGEA